MLQAHTSLASAWRDVDVQLIEAFSWISPGALPAADEQDSSISVLRTCCLGPNCMGPAGNAPADPNNISPCPCDRPLGVAQSTTRSGVGSWVRGAVCVKTAARGQSKLSISATADATAVAMSSSQLTPRSRPRLNPDCYKFIVSMLSTPDVLTFKAMSMRCEHIGQ